MHLNVSGVTIRPMRNKVVNGIFCHRKINLMDFIYHIPINPICREIEDLENLLTVWQCVIRRAIFNRIKKSDDMQTCVICFLVCFPVLLCDIALHEFKNNV